ncbi:MAG: outer membrane lipoprotein-sorting protein [Xanthomonadales bacterium]|nr:outer membrane lipoprotein-sorting protein [Xanthomonadales bacterium]
MQRWLLLLALTVASGWPGPALVEEPIDPRDIIRRAMEHWRGQTSVSEMTMIIQGDGWTRSMSMKSWSEGTELTLVRVTAPKKDAGTGTLLNGDNMWSFAPRINRVIKIPSSMMNQSWMGSDFSNKDISRSTDIIDLYDHRLEKVELIDGHEVYTIVSIPHEDAAIVWGQEIVRVRDDFLLLQQQFWDQDGVLVKQLETLDIAEMGGRSVARIMRMQEVETPDEWTELRLDQVEFDVDLPENTFTLANLRRR